MLHSEQEALADTAFETFNFGEGLRVIDSDNWSRDSYDGEDDWTKVVYVEADDDPADADSHKVSFHVKFTQGSLNLVEAYAYWCETGAKIGEA